MRTQAQTHKYTYCTRFHVGDPVVRFQGLAFYTNSAFNPTILPIWRLYCCCCCRRRRYHCYIELLPLCFFFVIHFVISISVAIYTVGVYVSSTRIDSYILNQLGADYIVYPICTIYIHFHTHTTITCVRIGLWQARNDEQGNVCFEWYRLCM